MPDSRLSITALVNGPLPVPPRTPPTAVKPPLTAPHPSLPSPASLSYVTWTRDADPRPPTPTPPALASLVPPPLPSSSVLSLIPTSTTTTTLSNTTASASPSPPKAPTSPQTIIVKTPRGKRHRCTFRGCGRDFTRLSNLKAHWRRHSGEEPYACLHCTRKFKWRSSLKSHELGCMYEFTKANAGLRWVYVATSERRSGEGDVGKGGGDFQMARDGMDRQGLGVYGGAYGGERFGHGGQPSIASVGARSFV